VQALIQNNTLFDLEGNGILMFAGQTSSGTVSTANLQATISNNTISSSTTYAFPGSGITIQSGVTGKTGATVCLNEVSNTINYLTAGTNYRFRKVTGSTFQLNGVGATVNDLAGLTAWLFNAPQNNLPNNSAEVIISPTAAAGYVTCSVVVPTF
jgi:hypothetical protein